MSVTGSSFQLRLIRPLQPADRNCVRSEEISQNRFEIPFGATNATEKIEAERSVFRKGVAREVRFGEWAEASDSAGTGKLVPLGLPHGAKLHLPDDSAEQILQDSSIAQRLRRATIGFDNPLDSAHGTQ